MKLIIRTLKIFGMIILGIVVILFLVGFLFISFSPQFGGKATEAEKEIYKKSGHYEEGLFQNEITTIMDMGLSKVPGLLGEYIRGNPDKAPKELLPVQKMDSTEIVNHPDSLTRITWFGHSAFLLEMDGQKILIDPMFGDVPAPHPWLGRGRFSNGLPIEIQKLPQIDAIILSHDHYDHLDYGSIKALMDKTRKFYTPLGVGVHLREWGIAPEKVHELNWWDEINHEGIKLVCTPARHFSGRGFSDRFFTFWSSWVIQGSNKNIYFSGDGGYGPHFKNIGEKYGPFDFAMMECGQYNEMWHNIHMMPEETAQASVDVQAKVMMPIHWGSFVLALHSWYDPVERVSNKAEELGQKFIIPQIGEAIDLNSSLSLNSNWWKELK